MTRTGRTPRYAIGAVLAGAMAVGMSGGAAARDIVIGVIGPLSGPAANSGISMRQAYEVAADQVNKAGGIELGGTKSKIKLIFEDSASRPEVGVSAAQKLLTRDNVDILVGDTIASSVTLALMEVAPSFGKFMMSGQPVSIEIAKKIKSDPKRFANFWKGGFNSDAYAEALFGSAQDLIKKGSIKAEKKTVGFIVEDTDYGKSNVEYTLPLFKKDGWTVSSNETVPLGYADFYPQLSKLRGKEPDVLISIFTSVNSGIALVKQIKEQGLKSTHMAVYYPIRPEFLKGAGASANGLLWTPLYFDPINNQKHKEFSENFKKEAKVEGNGDHAQGYCQMSMLLENIKKAGSIEPAKLSEAFAKTDSQCVIARMVYDTEIHTPKTGADFFPVPIAQIQDGVSFAIWPSTAATAEFKPAK
ncbi:ABC transporter substrate-binding protein [Enterovirga rhinocerotis]|uniref:Amino acid/amide ABC transporter substrate-binding protein (HAAT family) n=1 Tax=Enterovirga rhinocerotis TaxID=1339210 RepID=A0A4R7BVI6_9HYPH|nr:ABC transporter substrate-binding protein [Enterovirga rhinocerotis]TDR89844.1 amino acid/amide ABC transporter substrate-binding protein (HAAT family) [Enterovirga rhinocerotis]